jgi:hypothetical protein
VKLWLISMVWNGCTVRKTREIDTAFDVTLCTIVVYRVDGLSVAWPLAFAARSWFTTDITVESECTDQAAAEAHGHTIGKCLRVDAALDQLRKHFQRPLIQARVQNGGDFVQD